MAKHLQVAEWRHTGSFVDYQIKTVAQKSGYFYYTRETEKNEAR